MCDSAPIIVTITEVAPPPAISPYVIAGAIIGALVIVGLLAFRR